jgi:hypothetical protein
MFVQTTNNNLGVRSSNKQSLALNKTITIPSVMGMGFVSTGEDTSGPISLTSITDTLQGFSMATWALIGVGGFVLMRGLFGSNASARREGLAKAEQHYVKERREVLKKYPRTKGFLS